ncbi:MAG: TraR/DksA C4-type zinc finger protein [Longimicrobiales bacterium]
MTSTNGLERDDRDRREALEAELRKAMQQAGITGRAIESVMSAGCRLDGIGAGGVPETLAQSDRRVRARVEALAAALDRLDAGRYGRCQLCGESITDARLDVLPAATRCRACAD